MIILSDSKDPIRVPKIPSKNPGSIFSFICTPHNAVNMAKIFLLIRRHIRKSTHGLTTMTDKFGIILRERKLGFVFAGSQKTENQMFPIVVKQCLPLLHFCVCCRCGQKHFGFHKWKNDLGKKRTDFLPKKGRCWRCPFTVTSLTKIQISKL